MPDTILDDLFYGKVNPWENRPADIDEFRKLNKKMGQLSDILDKHLNDEMKDILNQYLSIRADMEMLLSSDSFKTGFQLGARLMIAIFQKP